ncbi:MAG: hypothetical protein H7Y04_11580 [Verrucomicrobia bacterium]|nr:hypothetical protein [Cytophagales bacterium]
MRFSAFFAVAVLFIALVAIGGKGSHPVMYLTGYGILAPIFITLLFTVMVSHEIIGNLLFLVTRTRHTPRSLLHFSVFSLVYLANMALLYLHNSGYIGWEIFYFDAFVVFGFSVVLGIWGFRRQSVFFQRFLPFLPQGAVLYMVLAMISLVTLAFFGFTANDPMVDVFEDAIIFSHLGIGIAFFLYVFASYSNLISQQMPIYQAVYDTRNSLFFGVRTLGLIIGIVLFVRENKYAYRQAFTGYYNNLADTYLLDNELIVAESYYKNANSFVADYNHKGNYALASIALANSKPDSAIYFLEKSFLKSATPQSYVALSDLYAEQNQFFKALFALQDGLRKFPANARIANNLAMLYHSKSIADSAQFYLNQSQRFGLDSKVLETNQLALILKNKLPVNTDSITKNLLNEIHIPLKTNVLALANMTYTNAKLTEPDFPKDTLLSRKVFAVWFNYGLSQRFKADSLLDKKLFALERKPENEIYSEDLKFARTVHAYYTSDKPQALNLMSNLQNDSQNRTAYFSRVQGLWFSQQGASERAIEYFGKAVRGGDTLSYLNRILAYADLGDYPQALTLLEERSIYESSASDLQVVLKALLEKDLEISFMALSDVQKTLFVRFDKNIGLDTQPLNLEKVQNSITIPEVRAWVRLTIAERLLADENNISAVGKVISALEKEKLGETNTKMLNFLRAKYAFVRQDFTALSQHIDKLSFPKDKENEKLFFRAGIAEAKKDTAQARIFYEKALLQMPLHENLVAKTADFYNRQNKPQKAYDSWIKAMLINPYSPFLTKGYTLQAIDLGYVNYADMTFQSLQTMLSPADYQAFVAVYQAKKALVEKNRGAFQ